MIHLSKFYILPDFPIFYDLLYHPEFHPAIYNASYFVSCLWEINSNTIVDHYNDAQNHLKNKTHKNYEVLSAV